MALLTSLYAAGFLIQILPCAFYCLYPFWDNFRFSRKGILVSAMLLLVLLDILFVWLGLFPPGTLLPHAAFLSELTFYLSLAALLCIYLFFIHAAVFHKLFVFFIVMSYGFFVTECVSLLCDAFPYWSEANYIYSPHSISFQLFFHGILLYPMLRLMRHIRRAFQSPVSKGMWKKLTLVPAGFIVLMCFTYRLPLYANTPDYITLELVTKATELFMLFLYYWIFRVMEQTQEQAKEHSRLEAMVNNYKALAQTSGQLHEMRHEIMHHIHALTILMNNQDYEGAKNYLASVDRIAALIPPVSYTAHPLLDSILTDYKHRAEDAGIVVRYQIYVPKPPAIEDIDLCQLLTNLMDNALEGCVHAEASGRSLSLTIRENGNFLFFSCENTCDCSLLTFRDGCPLPAQPSDEAHGHGILLMRRICDKYNGALKISAAEGRFKASINLCLVKNERRGTADVSYRNL